MLKRSRNFFCLALVTIASAALFSTQSLGLEVVKKNLKRSIFLVNEKLEIGIKVCVNGPKGKRLVCGKTAKVRGENTAVRVSKKRMKRLKRVKKGFAAFLADPKGQPLAGNPASQEAGQGQDSKLMSIKLLYMGGVVTPFTFNKLSYAAPESDTPQTLWLKNEPYNQAISGGGLEAEFFMGATMGLAIGGRYRVLTPFEAISFAVAKNHPTFNEGNNATAYVQTKTSAASVGGYFDYFYNIIFSASSILKVGAGIDVDMVDLSLLADRLNENSTETSELYTINAKTSIASLRLPFVYQYRMGGFGINFGIAALIPLSEFGKTFEPKITDSNSSLIPNTGAELDLETSLGLTKSSFGVDVLTGLDYTF